MGTFADLNKLARNDAEKKSAQNATRTGHEHNRSHRTGVPNADIERVGRTGGPNGDTEPADRTAIPNGGTAREESAKAPGAPPLDSALALEIAQGRKDPPRRETARMSFELYVDIKPRMCALQKQYRKRTSEHLSHSRIVREALDSYLDHLEMLLKQPDGGTHD